MTSPFTGVKDGGGVRSTTTAEEGVSEEHPPVDDPFDDGIIVVSWSAIALSIQTHIHMNMNL